MSDREYTAFKEAQLCLREEEEQRAHPPPQPAPAPVPESEEVEVPSKKQLAKKKYLKKRR